MDYRQLIDANLGIANYAGNAVNTFNQTIDTPPVPAGLLWKVRRVTAQVAPNNGGVSNVGRAGIFICPPGTPPITTQNVLLNSEVLLIPVIQGLIRVDDLTNFTNLGATPTSLSGEDFEVPPQHFLRFFASFDAIQNITATAPMFLQFLYAAIKQCNPGQG